MIGCHGNRIARGWGGDTGGVPPLPSAPPRTPPPTCGALQPCAPPPPLAAPAPSPRPLSDSPAPWRRPYPRRTAPREAAPSERQPMGVVGRRDRRGGGPIGAAQGVSGPMGGRGACPGSGKRGAGSTAASGTHRPGVSEDGDGGDGEGPPSFPLPIFFPLGMAAPVGSSFSRSRWAGVGCSPGPVAGPSCCRGEHRGQGRIPGTPFAALGLSRRRVKARGGVVCGYTHPRVTGTGAAPVMAEADWGHPTWLGRGGVRQLRRLLTAAHPRPGGPGSPGKGLSAGDPLPGLLGGQRRGTVCGVCGVPTTPGLQPRRGES